MNERRPGEQERYPEKKSICLHSTNSSSQFHSPTARCSGLLQDTLEHRLPEMRSGECTVGTLRSKTGDRSAENCLSLERS
jgi:hypothetical protein